MLGTILKMKKVFFACLVVVLIGCATTKVSTAVDYRKPYQVSVLTCEEEIIPEGNLKKIIEMMVTGAANNLNPLVSTYPTPEYGLRVIGEDFSGRVAEEIFDLGYSWIGNGQGIARMADTRAFLFKGVIEEVVAGDDRRIQSGSSGYPRFCSLQLQ